MSTIQENWIIYKSINTKWIINYLRELYHSMVKDQESQSKVNQSHNKLNAIISNQILLYIRILLHTYQFLTIHRQLSIRVPIKIKYNPNLEIEYLLLIHQWIHQVKLKKQPIHYWLIMEIVLHSNYVMRMSNSLNQNSLIPSMKRILTSSWWILHLRITNKIKTTLVIVLILICNNWLLLLSHPMMKTNKAKKKISNQLMDSNLI